MSEYFRKYIKKDHYPVHPSNIRFKTSFKNCVLEGLKRRTWKETDHETDWDIYWTEKEWIIDVMDHIHLAPTQRVNHFRNYYELCRKDNLIKNLKRHKKHLEKEGRLDEAAAYNFFPTTFSMPSEYSIFCEEFKRNSNSVWIMKPVGKAQGKGIFLFNKLSQVSQWKSDTRWKPDSPQVENYVVQRYINNPLLIGGKKFDMRIYVLVTSYSPLVVYLYRNGFARFTHHRYDNEDITNTFVHLTNVAIQKTSENYDEKLGGKWDLRTLKLYMVSQYGQEDVSECFANIQRVIIRALQSVQKIIIHDKHCFELYGFDILLDSNLKPWLIEVNGSPSMTANTSTDFELKVNLLDDVFTIIDMERVMTGHEEQVGGFDLICKGTPIKNESSLFATMLGCHNNRSQQLKKLAKMISSKLAQTYHQEKEEAKKGITGRDKDAQSTAPSDTSVTITKSKSNKTAAKVNPTGPVKNPKVPLMNKQNTMGTPKESNNTSMSTNNTSISGGVTKAVKGKLKEIGKSKTGVGLPPVNNNMIVAANSGMNMQGDNSQRVGQPGKSMQAGNGEKPSSLNSLKVGRVVSGGSMKSDGETGTEKRKSSKTLMAVVDQKQNVYNYNIGEQAGKGEEKGVKSASGKNSDDLTDSKVRVKLEAESDDEDVENRERHEEYNSVDRSEEYE